MGDWGGVDVVIYRKGNIYWGPKEAGGDRIDGLTGPYGEFV